MWIAIIGLCVGSFLNVVIGRLPEDDDLDVPEPKDWWERWKLPTQSPMIAIHMVMSASKTRGG